jgi:hypothetical protein
MYIGIIYFSGIQRGEKNPSIATPTIIPGNVEIDTTNGVRIDSAETLEDITGTTDSFHSYKMK